MPSRAGDRQYRYSWNDINGDRQFTVNERGCPAVGVSDPSLVPVTMDPDLEPTETDEFTVGVTRELASNLSVSRHLSTPQGRRPDVADQSGRDGGDYTRDSGRDPGPDGVLGTGRRWRPIDFYNINPAKSTLSPNFITTLDGFTQHYDGVELTLYRRYANKWQFVGSYTAGRRRRSSPPARSISSGHRAGLPTPQDVDKRDGTRDSASRSRQIVKFLGSYLMPWNITSVATTPTSAAIASRGR